jgi:hypothetical protein
MGVITLAATALPGETAARSFSSSVSRKNGWRRFSAMTASRRVAASGDEFASHHRC